MWASAEGREQVVDVLLKAGTDYDIQSNSCWTALIEATKCGNKNIVKSLIRRKADTNITDMVCWCLL
jgi:ankyrin repeat protein